MQTFNPQGVIGKTRLKKTSAPSEQYLEEVGKMNEILRPALLFLGREGDEDSGVYIEHK